ncbi:hypothetical protein BH09MYX1_BH09MYX1_64110 [soil metagenome]
MRFASAAAAASMALGLIAACGSERPPPLGDPKLAYDASAVDAGYFDGSTPPPTCDLGPDYGVCACSEVRLLGDVPNLYFVLDRSGSMIENDKWKTVRVVVVQTVTRLGPRVNVGAAIYPSDQSCGAGKEVLSTRPGDSPAGVFGPTANALATATAVPELGGTSTSSTLAGLTSKITKLTGKTFVILATDGAPNCNPGAVCGADECQSNIEALQGCPKGGQPNCCATGGRDGPEFCLDSAATYAAIDALAAAGVDTYVIGVPGSGPYSEILDQMAIHGGTGRGTSPEYYRVDSTDAKAFGDARTAIAAKITATCTFPLESVPEPEKLNVFFDGVVLPKDEVNGWKLDGTKVEVVGAACEKLKRGEILSVRVVAGCPTIVPK